VTKQAPCVDLRTDVHKDERFNALALIAGFPGGRFEAIGRMHALWSWCVDRVLRDAPDDSDGYVVSSGVVRQFLGQSGEMALLAEGCDELALGILISPGRYYLKGTSKYVSARRQLAATAKSGGESRAAAFRQNGKYVVADNTKDQPYRVAAGDLGVPTTSPEPAHHPAGQPAAASDLPSSSSSLSEKSVSGARPDQLILRTESRTEPPKRTREPKKPSEGTEAIAHFNRRFEEAYGTKPEWARQAANFHGLAKRNGADEVIRRTDLLFDGMGPTWMKPPFTPGTLVSRWNDLIEATPTQQGNGGIREGTRIL
jgi:hypothetical protein